MIPVKLSLSGFLSYRQPIELDFSNLDLACISGPNGAGKSSLLDAITWALFGQARKRDDSVINTYIKDKSKGAEVSFTFQYEGNTYRVQRSKQSGKTTVLEFAIQGSDGRWKPLTERTLRDTEARIQETLRLDYETFVNASFFLQGKADQFTQQRPADRKRILGSILGLEAWEDYRKAAFERRKTVDGEIAQLDGRIQEINAELGEEDSRKARLKELESDLKRISAARQAQETALEEIRRRAAGLAEQQKLVETLANQLGRAQSNLETLEGRFQARLDEKLTYDEVISQAEQIEADYQEWQETRAELERWEEVAKRFHEQEKRRHEPLTKIETARTKLETEAENLREQYKALNASIQETKDFQSQVAAAQKAIEENNAKLAERARLEEELAEARKQHAEAEAENPRLRKQMEETKERIEQLSESDGATCPLCGQPLSPENRQSLIAELTAEGKQMGDRYRSNKALLEQADGRVKALEESILALGEVEAQLRNHTREFDQATAHIQGIEKTQTEWEAQGAPKLAEIEKSLKGEDYAKEARQALAKVDAELKKIGYDAAAHDAARQAESEKRSAENELRGLENARAALVPIEREIGELDKQIEGQKEEVAQQRTAHDEAAAAFAAAQAEAPDVESAEAELLDAQEQENKLRLEVGAAQQKVLVLKDLRKRKDELNAEREELARKVEQFKALERAFSKDGVPAMLIEQALPQIQTKANEILGRLTGDEMSLTFITQQEYKDTRRSDMKETLDIQISDRAGVRDYEMYSGGEAFRINFAIRLALSEVLAQRAGARLQTLVIDEGFGSQDEIGRQRLIEAINLVKDDFAKILVITHIDSLKDAFPHRIEVEKTLEGSVVRVV